MINVYENLYIGDTNSCIKDTGDEWVVIHACKIPCYSLVVPNSNPSHPNYLVYRSGNHLMLNMIDSNYLDKRFGNTLYKASLEYLQLNSHKKVLIHCNQGKSRSASITLVYLAIQGVINNQTYKLAKEAFIKLYPLYTPGKGVDNYLNENWNYLMS